MAAFVAAAALVAAALVVAVAAAAVAATATALEATVVVVVVVAAAVAGMVVATPSSACGGGRGVHADAGHRPRRMLALMRSGRCHWLPTAFELGKTWASDVARENGWRAAYPVKGVVGLLCNRTTLRRLTARRMRVRAGRGIRSAAACVRGLTVSMIHGQNPLFVQTPFVRSPSVGPRN